jgi:hypothetical protein
VIGCAELLRIEQRGLIEVVVVGRARLVSVDVPECGPGDLRKQLRARQDVVDVVEVSRLAEEVERIRAVGVPGADELLVMGSSCR